MRQPLRLVTAVPPALAPVTLDQIKLALKIDPDATEDDALIAGLIRTASDACERFTGRALIARTLTLWLDAWPAGRDHHGRAIELPRPPLRSVTFVKVYDDMDASMTVAPSTYFVDTAGDIGRIAPRLGTTAPSPGRVANGIEIQFEAGYGPDPTDVPEPLRAGIERLAVHLYEHRGDDPAVAPGGAGAEALWGPYRVIRL